MLVAVVLLTGCATTIVPPVTTDPVDVFLLDHGRTTSLVLPAPDDAMVRYAYGDWNWYALGNNRIVDGVRALVGPSAGTFGRQEIAGPANAETIRQRFPAAYIVNLHTVRVDRRKADRLRARLDAQHLAGRRIALVQTAEFDFVPDERAYSYFHNSNHVIAEWLRDLGCETRGLAFNSQWVVGERRSP